MIEDEVYFPQIKGWKSSEKRALWDGFLSR